MSYPLYNQSGATVKEIKLNPAIFEAKVNPPLVHQVAVAQLANARQVLAHTKTKGEVRGGGKKPWKQKGTGRARHGSSRSPLWVGGGVTFGPRNTRNFTQKVNKKMKRLALFSCLTDKAQNQTLTLLDNFTLSDSKTKAFAATLLNLQNHLKLQPRKKAIAAETEKNSVPAKDLKTFRSPSLLVVAGTGVSALSRAGRNLPGVKIIGANSLNVVDLLHHKNLLLTEDSLAVIEKTYLK